MKSETIINLPFGEIVNYIEKAESIFNNTVKKIENSKLTKEEKKRTEDFHLSIFIDSNKTIYWKVWFLSKKQPVFSNTRGRMAGNFVLVNFVKIDVLNIYYSLLLLGMKACVMNRTVMEDSLNNWEKKLALLTEKEYCLFFDAIEDMIYRMEYEYVDSELLTDYFSKSRKADAVNLIKKIKRMNIKYNDWVYIENIMYLQYT